MDIEALGMRVFILVYFRDVGVVRYEAAAAEDDAED